MAVMNATCAWTMADSLRHSARDYPQRNALIFQGATLTYRDLDQRANAVANGLLGLRTARQARVAFLDFNNSVYFEVFFGSLKVDCAMLGVNARLAPPEVLFVLNDATASVLFVGPEHVALIESIETRLTTVKHIIALGGGHARWPDYRSWRDAQPLTDPDIELHADSDVIQLYTSGTTGHPKGVCHTNRTWAAFADSVQLAGWGVYDSKSVTFVCMPLFHVAGFNLSCRTLFGGGCAVLSRRVDAEEILDFIPRYGITDTLIVPTIIQAVVLHPRAATTDFSSLACICYGAAPIADALLERAQELFGCDFVHLYGMTEILGGATYMPAEMHHSKFGKLKSCGRAYAGLELKIIDAEGNVLPVGQTGEIILRCAWLMNGYWRNQAATDESIRNGWFHTGDAAYLDTDGYVYIQDRVKDMIISGGENIYPAEVENALFGHPAVQEVAVIGVPDEKWGEVIKAMVVLKSGATLDAADMMRYARARIAGYKVPKSFEAIAMLPRNASGKVLRRQLREPYWRDRTRQIN